MSTLTQNYYSKIHPKRFVLWLFLGSIVMMFAGLTSAFIVRRAQGNWVEYALPDIFWLSTAMIILSSLTLHLAYVFHRDNKAKKYRMALGATLFLGLGFVLAQYIGWTQLTELGVRLQGNPSGSFLYVISGVHAAHLLGGVALLLIFFFKSIRRQEPVKRLMEEIDPERTLGVELLLTYWHFVGLLWLYLFIFFLYFG